MSTYKALRSAPVIVKLESRKQSPTFARVARMERLLIGIRQKHVAPVSYKEMCGESAGKIPEMPQNLPSGPKTCLRM